MKLDVELDWDYVAIRLLDKHSHLVVDNEGLASLVVAGHEIRVPFTNQLWHHILNPIQSHIGFTPAQ